MSSIAFIGWRHLRATRKTFLSTLTTLAILGVALSVSATTVVVSVATGFVDTFRDNLLGVNAHVVVTRYGMFFAEYRQVQEALEEVDGVVATTPYILHEMLITSTTSRTRPGVLVKGTDIDVFANEIISDRVDVVGDLTKLRYNGSLRSDPSGEERPPGIALGSVLAERLKVEIGDVVTLLSPMRSLSTLGLVAEESGPTWARFRVEAIMSTGFYDYDHRLALMDYHAMQDLFGRGDMVTGVEIRLKDGTSTEASTAAIGSVLTTGRYQVLDWPRIHRNLFASLNLQKLAVTLLMGALIVVASSVILCVLIMLVLQKRRDIAILRTMGATRAMILRLFMFQGLVIGFVGTVLGIIGGLALCWLIGSIDYSLDLEVYRIDHLPVTVNWRDLVGIALGTFVICGIATIHPAIQAAKISPVDGLRNDA